MVKSMTEALSIPHFGYYDEVNMTELVKLRKELKKSPMLGEVQFTYMPVMIKVTHVFYLVPLFNNLCNMFFF